MFGRRRWWDISGSRPGVRKKSGDKDMNEIGGKKRSGKGLERRWDVRRRRRMEVRAEHLFGNQSLPSVQCNTH